MGGNSYDTYGEGSASTYWRRRFIVLAIGLVVFGLAAWGLSSALAVKSVPASRAGRAGARPVDQARLGSQGQDQQGQGQRAGQGSVERPQRPPFQLRVIAPRPVGPGPPRFRATEFRPGSADGPRQPRRLGPSRWPDRRWPGGKRPVRWRPVRSQVRSAPSRKEAKQEPVRRPVTERSCRPSAVVVTSC